MIKSKNHILKVCLAFLILVFLMINILNVTLAYFRYSTYLYGEGTLPILRLHPHIENINSINALKTITYNGQSETELAVSFDTNGNNIDGKLRIKVSFIWQDNLTNTPYNNESVRVKAANVLLVEGSSFTNDGDVYYLDSVAPDTTINFITAIKFADGLPSNYNGRQVSVYIMADLIQVNKEWN